MWEGAKKESRGGGRTSNIPKCPLEAADKQVHNSVIPAAAKIVVTNLDLVFLLRQKCLVCLSFFFCLGHSELPGGNIVS